MHATVYIMQLSCI